MLNCCKCLQINRAFFQVLTDLSEGRKWIDWGGTVAKGAMCVFHHLAQSQDQRQTASAVESCAQLEFQSTI